MEVKLHSKVVEHHSSLTSILYATSVILKLFDLSFALYTALLLVAFVLKSSQNRIFRQFLSAVCQGGKVYNKFLQSGGLLKLLFYTLLDEIFPLFIYFYHWGVFVDSTIDLFWSLDSHYINFF